MWRRLLIVLAGNPLKILFGWNLTIGALMGLWTDSGYWKCTALLGLQMIAVWVLLQPLFLWLRKSRCVHQQ